MSESTQRPHRVQLTAEGAEEAGALADVLEALADEHEAIDDLRMELERARDFLRHLADDPAKPVVRLVAIPGGMRAETVERGRSFTTTRGGDT